MLGRPQRVAEERPQAMGEHPELLDIMRSGYVFHQAGPIEAGAHGRQEDVHGIVLALLAKEAMLRCYQTPDVALDGRQACIHVA